MAIAKITTDNIADLTKGLSTIFDEARVKSLKAMDYKKYIGQSIDLPNSDIIQFEVGSDIPKLYKWDQSTGRTIQKIGKSNITAKTVPWEATVEVKENDILFDRLGLVKSRVENLPVAENIEKYDQTLRVLAGYDIDSAATVRGTDDTTAYDGTALYGEHTVKKYDPATDAFVNGTTYTNKLTSKTLNAANLSKVKVAMTALKDAYGRPMGNKPTVLMVSEELEATATDLMDMVVNSNGATNVQYKKYEVLVNPYLSAKEWVLLDLDLSPAFEVITRDIRFRSGEEVGNYTLFNKGLLQYGIDSQYVIGTGLFEGCILAIGS